MSNAIIATLIFAAAIGGLVLFFALAGRLSFWTLAAKLPDQAMEFFLSDSAWIVPGDSAAPPRCVGPFLLSVPSLGRTVKIYGDPEHIEESQARFMERYKHDVPQRGFPHLSLLALLYPVAAMLSMNNTPAPVVAILGYGLANLGYLLVASGLLAGHFFAFGLERRISTFLAAGVLWLAGLVLSNIA